MDHQHTSEFSAKQVADLLTFFRGFLSLILIWLGLTHGAAGLTLAVYLMLLSWTSDSLDGPLARHSRRRYHSWLGDHDLEVDMAVSAGLLVFMVAAGLLEPAAAGIYLLIWAVIFWRCGMARSLGMLIQAPIYGWFIWVALRDARSDGRWLVIWVIAALIATWPRFPKTVLPAFFSSIQSLREDDSSNSNLR